MSGKPENKPKTAKYIVLLAAGTVLFAAGLYLLKQDFGNCTEILPYLSIGIGAGLFGHSVGALANIWTAGKYPEEAKRMAIEEKDERNTAIADKAKSKAFSMTLYVFGALLIAFALMKADLVLLITLVLAYLFVTAVMVYYLWKYQKEM